MKLSERLGIDWESRMVRHSNRATRRRNAMEQRAGLTGELSRAPRIFHEIYATIQGYYWLPCPVCGEEFGGHEPHGSLCYEWNDDGQPVTFRATCILCKWEAERRNNRETYRRLTAWFETHNSWPGWSCYGIGWLKGRM